jgi:hypothetical protein
MLVDPTIENMLIGSGKTRAKTKKHKKKKIYHGPLETFDKSVIQNISKFLIKGEGPKFSDDLALEIIESSGFFPLCWDLDRDLYPLLQKHPEIAERLNLSMAKDFGAIRKTKEGEKSLFDAVHKGDVSSMKGLLSAGVNVNAMDSDRYSPLHWAAYYGYEECIKGILDLKIPGTDVNIKGEYNKTPLHEAVTQNHNECVKILLSAPGIDVNARTEDERTPLHWGVDYKSMECIKTLLADPRIDANAVDRDGRTPRDIAIANAEGNQDIVELFKNIPMNNKGGKPKTKSSKETTTYCGKKYVVRIGSRGGRYILVGTEKKKVYV